jgi:hypothetical protein
MQHVLHVRLRLHVHETEVRQGQTPRDTAESLLREIMTVDDELLEIRLVGRTWTSKPITGP